MVRISAAIDQLAVPHKRKLLFGLLTAAAVVVLDFFIVLACLPAIEQVLGATKAQLQLILAVYAIANASLLVVGGRLGDVLGRRRAMMWGLVGFALSSLACALSTGPWFLIAFRAVQGLSGALVQPQVLGLLAVNFDVQQRPRVFGLYAAALGCAGIAAQLLGGLFVGFFDVDLGWRLCFILSVPVCAVAMALASTADDGQRRPRQSIDFFGALVLGVSLACMCTFLTVGREQGWPGWSFWVLAAGLSSSAALAAWLRKGYRTARDRIIPSGIMAENGFWLALLQLLSFYGGVASLYFVIALELRLAEGLSPVQVGLLFGWLAVCFVVTSTNRRIKSLIGARWAEVGLSTLLAGHLAMWWIGSWSSPANVAGFVLSTSLQGIGLGCMMGRLMGNALSHVRPERASVGGGIASATQQVGNSLGIAAIGFAYFAPGSGSSNLAGAVMYLSATVLAVAFFVVLGRRTARE